MPSKLPARRKKRSHPFNDLYGLKTWRKEYKQQWNAKYKNSSAGSRQMWQLMAEHDMPGWGLKARGTYNRYKIHSWLSQNIDRRNADRAHFRESLRRKYPREVVSNIAKWFK